MGKLASKGTLLKLSISSVYTTVVYVSKIDGPDAEVQTTDVTALDSGVGMEDGEPTGHTAPGSISGECFYDPQATTHQALIALLGAPAKRDWKVVFPDGDASEIAFSGVLKKFTPQGAVNDYVKASFEIKLTGLATYPS